MFKQVMPILMITILFFGLTPSFSSQQLTTQKTTKTTNIENNYYWLQISHKTKLNGETIPENITIIKIIPENIQYNISILSEKVMTGIDCKFMLLDTHEWEITPTTNYYNSTIETRVIYFPYIENKSPTEHLYVTHNYQDPEKLPTYFFAPIDKLLDLLKKQTITIPQLISDFGKDSFITFAIDNNTEFFPTMGSEKQEYYYRIQEQQKNYEQALASYSNGETLNISSKMIWRVVTAKNHDASPPQAPITNYNNTITVSMTTRAYDLKMQISQELQFYESTLSVIAFHNNIYYLNKENNTNLEISNHWAFLMHELIANNNSSGTTETAPFPYYSLFVGLLIIVPLIRVYGVTGRKTQKS